MLKKLDHNKMGRSDSGWLKALFHFSFADYYNPQNINFGVLRVLNDDIIGPTTGFETHPHKDMEIITYVVEGELTHGDSMGNKSTISRGHIQYMSAGTGIYHNEHNLSDQPLRSLQIWIVPDKKNYDPNYGDSKFEWALRKNKWLHMVSDKTGEAPIKVNQDVNFYVLELDQGKEIQFPIKENRQAYLVQIEGTSQVNGITLNTRDAMEIIEETIVLKASETSHYIIIEMEKTA